MTTEATTLLEAARSRVTSAKAWVSSAKKQERASVKELRSARDYLKGLENKLLLSDANPVSPENVAADGVVSNENFTEHVNEEVSEDNAAAEEEDVGGDVAVGDVHEDDASESEEEDDSSVDTYAGAEKYMRGSSENIYHGEDKEEEDDDDQRRSSRAPSKKRIFDPSPAHTESSRKRKAAMASRAGGIRTNAGPLIYGGFETRSDLPEWIGTVSSLLSLKQQGSSGGVTPTPKNVSSANGAKRGRGRPRKNPEDLKHPRKQKTAAASASKKKSSAPTKKTKQQLADIMAPPKKLQQPLSSKYNGVSKTKERKSIGSSMFESKFARYRMGCYVLEVDAALAYDGVVRSSGRKEHFCKINFTTQGDYLNARNEECASRGIDMDLEDSLGAVTARVNDAKNLMPKSKK